MNTIRTIASQPLRASFLGRPVTPWHAVLGGTTSLVGSAWLFSTVALGWPSHRLPVLYGAFVLPMCFVIGLAVFAFAIVALRRQRDGRLAAGALLGFLAVALFVVSFLIAAGGAGK